jgi:hypothetical protein
LQHHKVDFLITIIIIITTSLYIFSVNRFHMTTTMHSSNRALAIHLPVRPVKDVDPFVLEEDISPLTVGHHEGGNFFWDDELDSLEYHASHSMPNALAIVSSESDPTERSNNSSNESVLDEFLPDEDVTSLQQQEHHQYPCEQQQQHPNTTTADKLDDDDSTYEEITVDSSEEDGHFMPLSSLVEQLSHLRNSSTPRHAPRRGSRRSHPMRTFTSYDGNDDDLDAIEEHAESGEVHNNNNKDACDANNYCLRKYDNSVLIRLSIRRLAAQREISCLTEEMLEEEIYDECSEWEEEIIEEDEEEILDDNGESSNDHNELDLWDLEPIPEPDASTVDVQYGSSMRVVCDFQLEDDKDGDNASDAPSHFSLQIHSQSSSHSSCSSITWYEGSHIEEVTVATEEDTLSRKIPFSAEDSFFS